MYKQRSLIPKAKTVTKTEMRTVTALRYFDLTAETRLNRNKVVAIIVASIKRQQVVH